MNISKSILFLILLGFTSSASAQNIDTEIDAFIKAKMQQRNIPGLQLAIIRNGSIVKNSTYGQRNLENSIPATNESLFNINSITKAFTGVAIMQLAEAGKLKVSDKLSQHLDSLPESWKEITLSQVLAHTSGLPDILDEDEQVYGNNVESLALKKVMSMPVVSKPGDRWAYNQTGYVLLGKIITKASGMHFTEFIKEKQFKPAGMVHTRFGDAYDVIPNYAGAYTMTKQVGNSLIRNNTPGISYIQFPTFFRAAAGIISTASDMANWLIALKGGNLLREDSSLSLMWEPVKLNNGQIRGFNQLTNGYALGWPTVTRSSHPAVAPVGGGRSAFFLYPKDDLAIVVLTNLMGANPDQFIDEIAGFYYPDMKEENGFGLSDDIKKLRSALLVQGFDKAEQVATNLRKAEPSFHLDERDLNGWGYKLLSQKKVQESAAIFKLNVWLYPQSANAYDSLGEIMEIMGNKLEALASYKRSLELDPENKNAKERIKDLSEH